MSIAASVLIRPSPCLRLLMAGMAALVLAATVWLFLFVFPSRPSYFGLALVFPCALAAFGILLAAFRTRKWFLLDISGLGQIRLGEHYTGAAAAWWKETTNPLPPGKAVRLLGMSTLWSCLLALQLQDEQGKTSNVLILPDSVAPGAFRALSLSLRWLAARERAGAELHNEF